MNKRALCILILTALGFTGGCVVSPLNQAQIDALAVTPYPKAEGQVQDADIIVTQSRTQITFNNRTAHEFHYVYIWLNQQFVTKIKVLKIGDPDINTIPLTVFIDKNHEIYPIGGLLTPDRAFPVVSAEIFDPATGKKYRVIPR